MTKRKPVLVLFIITALFLIGGAVVFAITALFGKDADLQTTFAALNQGILACFTGKNQITNIASIAGSAVLFVIIPLIVHLVRKQHSVTVILLLGSLIALYVELLVLSYTDNTLLPLIENISSKVQSEAEAIQKLLMILIGLGLIGVAGIFELITFIVDMCIRVKREPEAVATAQAVREEPVQEEQPAPAEEPAPEEVKEEPAPAPVAEPEVVEEPKEEPKEQPQQTVININVVGVQPAEEKKEEPEEEEEEEEKPAKKAPAKKPAKKEEKKPAAKKAPAKKEEPKKASRETTTIKKPTRETQTVKKAEILTNEEGKQFAKAYHISQRKELNKWQVKGAGSDKAIKLFDTQKEAIEYANELSAKNGAAVRVHSRAGKMRKA